MPNENLALNIYYGQIAFEISMFKDLVGNTF